MHLIFLKNMNTKKNPIIKGIKKRFLIKKIKKKVKKCLTIIPFELNEII